MIAPSRTALIGALLVLLGAAAARAEVLVRLRPASAIPARVVTVGDAAELTGGEEARREAIRGLDLSELPPGQTTARVSRRQVEFRIAVAGVPAGTYRVEGPEVAQVTLRLNRVKAEEVVAAARKELESRLPWPAGEAVIELAQPVIATMPEVTGGDRLEVKASLRAGQRPVGRVQMDVSLHAGGRHLLSLPVHFNVKPCQQVVICRQRIEKGEAIDDANVYFEMQPVDARSGQALAPKAARGARARQALVPGQVLLSTDVEAGGPPANPVLVRAQEPVRLQVRVGSLRVTAAGQALQEGRRGQLIRVQNVDSKKVLVGKVIDAGLVEVE